MAPYVQPKTLYALALSKISNAVSRACDIIQVCFGDYDTLEGQEQAANLQKYLLSSLPGVVVDELCDDRKYVNYTPGVDVRIRLAVYLHPFMRKFSVAQLTGELRQELDTFWIHHFASLSRLVVINLYHVATDEIIEVISDSCPLLEDINIVSKVEDVRGAENVNFNAMKLKFFVSDVGLGHLVKCKKLRVVTTNKALRSNCGGRMMTHDGFRTLLKGLPKLEMIRYGDLGSVIASGMDDVGELELTYLSDNHPDTNHIETVSRLCPKLKHLSLSLPPHQERGTTPDALSEEVARALSRSNIKVSVLELQHFKFNQDVTDMLALKGDHLTSLFLCSLSPITSEEVLTIGTHCPNVKNVHIKGLGRDSLAISSKRYNMYRNEPMFTQLRCLYVSGKSWDIELVLSLFLSCAFELSGLSVWNGTISSESDKALMNVMERLPFKELKSANFCYGCRLTLDAVRNFIYRCPKLTHLTVFEHDGLQPVAIEGLQKEAIEKNLDIELLSLQIG